MAPHDSPERPTIPASRFVERLAAARGLAETAGIDAFLIGVGADLRYLAGYPAMPLERLTMLVVPARGAPALVVPRLEAAPARLCPPAASGDLPVVTWEEGGDAYAVVADLVLASERGSPSDLRHRVSVSDDLPARHLLPLQQRLPDHRLSLASAILRELRMIKDPDEIALLTLAAHAADRVVAQIAAGRLIGRTEADVAQEVRAAASRRGSRRGPVRHRRFRAELRVAPPRGLGSRHRRRGTDRARHRRRPRRVRLGHHADVMGHRRRSCERARTSGSGTSSTCSRARRRPVAPRSGPGSPGEAVDAAARRVIDGEGYGDAFFHRTGHGIGLEGHEEPYIIGGNLEALRPGMAFSVEPGIYFPGEYGARIEDIVVCGPDGPIELNEAPRELYVVDG